MNKQTNQYDESQIEDLEDKQTDGINEEYYQQEINKIYDDEIIDNSI